MTEGRVHAANLVNNIFHLPLSLSLSLMISTFSNPFCTRIGKQVILNLSYKGILLLFCCYKHVNIFFAFLRYFLIWKEILLLRCFLFSPLLVKRDQIETTWYGVCIAFCTVINDIMVVSGGTETVEEEKYTKMGGKRKTRDEAQYHDTSDDVKQHELTTIRTYRECLRQEDWSCEGIQSSKWNLISCPQSSFLCLLSIPLFFFPGSLTKRLVSSLMSSAFDLPWVLSLEQVYQANLSLLEFGSCFSLWQQRAWVIPVSKTVFREGTSQRNLFVSLYRFFASSCLVRQTTRDLIYHFWIFLGVC